MLFLMRLPPILKALLLQLVAVGSIVLLLRVSGWRLPLWGAALAMGALAAVLSHRARFPRWWLPIQLLFVPALAAAFLLDLPSWLYLGGFLVLALVYWSTYRSQVPLYLSSRASWLALEDLLPQDRSFRFADIGAGVGGVLAHLAKVRPDGYFVGIENAPLPCLMAWLRLRGRSNCAMLHGDFWKMNFSEYDVVHAYLSPVPMARLWEKACREMQPGSLLVSNTFEIPGLVPDRVIELGDFHRSRLLVWKIPAATH